MKKKKKRREVNILCRILLTPLMLFWPTSRLKKETLTLWCTQLYAKCWSHHKKCLTLKVVLLSSCSYNPTVQKVWFNLCMSRKMLACSIANLCAFCFWSCTSIGPILSCLSHESLCCSFCFCIFFPSIESVNYAAEFSSIGRLILLQIMCLHSLIILLFSP